MTVRQLVKAQRESGEETEFYPTTQEIVDAIAPHISGSVLDIGCGNGAFFDKLDKAPFADRRGDEPYGGQKYGMEKSVILSDELPADVVLIGTDFHQQSLVDKRMDFIWCNPPYSEYEEWAEKIIAQGNAPRMGMVIPERWVKSDRIREALFSRNMEAEVIGEFDFLEAERKARAKVHLLFIHGKKCGKRFEGVKDAFDTWFDSTFSINAEKDNRDADMRDETIERMENGLVKGANVAETLVELYNSDLERIYGNYKSLEALDAGLFKELKVDIPGLKEALKLRLRNLKTVYWKRLFECYNEITSRLTSFSVGKITNRLMDNTSIDFTLENIFQMTMWVIKNSNRMYDEQLMHYYLDLIRPENITRYKSNRHWTDEKWRYAMDAIKGMRWRSDADRAVRELKGVALEYRIIVEAYGNFDTWNPRRLSASAFQFIKDTCCIGKSLGFDLDDSWLPREAYLTDGDWSSFDIETRDGNVFCNMKLYKNGNRHIRFSKEAVKRLNVEAGRLFGWIRSKDEAKEDLGVSDREAEEMWMSNFQYSESGVKLLTA